MESDQTFLNTMFVGYFVVLPTVLIGYALYKRAEYMGFPEFVGQVREYGWKAITKDTIQEIQEEESNSLDYETINKLVE